MKPEFTNALIEETSPYLLQHAHNPVNWEAWRPEVLAKAKKENRLLLISIGYAACHWCHVMEHECFEDVEVSNTMNAHFVNIKIDREERPDVDHIYMDALQMMTGSGGWPLNIVALPDGRPFWGATFVKKNNWIQILQQLADLYQNDPARIEGYAQSMAEGIRAINLIEPIKNPTDFNLDKIGAAVTDWSQYFDHDFGGYDRAPKFMMPVNLNFLLHYGTAQKNRAVLKYVDTSLTKMAWGGIFDHVGGGFSRYAVDIKWHVPHFEKMLYDNGQLISLYAQAYAATGNVLYRETVAKTVAFVQRELMSSTFGFYSSLDADSLTENDTLEEGAYYVWGENKLKSLLGSHFDIFKEVFNINAYGFWEEDKFVLIRNAPKIEIAEKHSIPPDTLDKIIDECLEILNVERNTRHRPRLDDKILTSWNGLMLKGLTDAYRYLGDTTYLNLAFKNAEFILQNLIKKDGGLYHNHKHGRSTINGYLEDYASVIEAFVGLYEISAREKWLHRAKKLTEYCRIHFFDERSGMFFFTSKDADYVIRRTIETSDNVVPASNSIMAKNLFKLSKFFPKTNYEALSLQMLQNIQENALKNTQSHANWLQLALYFEHPFYEVAVVGHSYQEKSNGMRSRYLPDSILAATKKESALTLLQGRYENDRTLIYVCKKGTCQLPVTKIDDAIEQFRSSSKDSK